DAGAADADQPHAHLAGARQHGLGHPRDRRRRAARRLRRDDLHERRAIALEAGEVLVAGALMDAGLAAELGLDRLDRQAAGLLAAVAAALAHPLVDDDRLRRR